MTSDESLASAAQSQIRVANFDANASDAGPRVYSTATSIDRGRQVHDLFPARYLTIALIAAAGLTAIAGIALLHLWCGSLADTLSVVEVAAFDLSGPHNISHWFAAMLLGAASLVAMFIYSLRRHRLDDYHGRYRVWAWVVMACLFASLSESAHVGWLGRGVCRRAAESCGLDTQIVWLTALSIVIGGLAIRLAIEVRRSRTTLLALLLAVAAFAVAWAIDLGWIAQLATSSRSLVMRASCLVGYVFVLVTFLLYTRHVIREIGGLCVAPAPKPKRTRHARPATPKIASEPSPPSHSRPRTDLDPVAPQAPQNSAVRSSAATDIAPPAATNGAAANGISQQGQPLSRADRRRQRRETARQAS